MKITIHQRQIEALFHRAAQAAETARDTASEAAGLAPSGLSVVASMYPSSLYL